MMDVVVLGMRNAECGHFPHDSSMHTSSTLLTLETSEQSRDILSKKETTF
jgi:hypothetical protein